MKEPRSVVVKSLVVDRNPKLVTDFFLDLKNWESGGTLSDVKKIDAEWWSVNTPQGSARIRLRENKQMGIFDHDFIGRGAEWTASCRITPNERGSTVTWLFIRPDGMPQEQFENQLGTNFDREMQAYKKAIESL